MYLSRRNERQLKDFAIFTDHILEIKENKDTRTPKLWQKVKNVEHEGDSNINGSQGTRNSPQDKRYPKKNSDFPEPNTVQID